jgi:capsular polysaccharide export protein
MERIGFLVNNEQQLLFSRNLGLALNSLGYKTSFYTASPSLSYFSSITLIASKFRGKPQENLKINSLAESLEFQLGIMGVSDIAKNANRVWVSFTHELSKNPIDRLFVWQPWRLVGLVLKDLCQREGVNVSFLEIGNFPGRTFVDFMGVNANCSLAENKNILNALPAVSRDADAWYQAAKGKMSSPCWPPQANVNKRSRVFRLSDVIFGQVGLGLRESKSTAVARAFRNNARKEDARYNTGHINWQRTPEYVLFPMQVTTDSQVIINSEIGVFEALELAVDLARKSGVMLIVKPHPAERDSRVINCLINLSENGKLIISNDNIFDLITRCSGIYTINSTVGILGLIEGKPVRTFGRSFYSEFGPEEALQYAYGWLAPVDSFSNDVISEEQARQVLMRSRAGGLEARQIAEYS